MALIETPSELSPQAIDKTLISSHVGFTDLVEALGPAVLAATPTSETGRGGFREAKQLVELENRSDSTTFLENSVGYPTRYNTPHDNESSKIRKKCCFFTKI